MNRSLLTFLSLIITIVLISGAVLFTNHTKGVDAATTVFDLTGSAWSDAGGWVNFNCANDTVNGCGTSNYKVTTDSTGRLRGYAWSYNLGWLSFEDNDIKNCPTAPCSPTIDVNGAGTIKKISGYGRFLTGIGRTDGFDGWVELSGVNHESPGGSGVKLTQSNGVPANSTQGNISGWAFGDVLGWLQFNTSVAGTQCPPGSSFNFQTGVCVPDSNPCSGTYPVNAVLSTAQENGAVWAYIGTTPPGSAPTSACKFTCPSNATWNSKNKTCDVPVGTSQCVPVPANSIACPNNTGNAPIVLLTGTSEQLQCQTGIHSGLPMCEFYCPLPLRAHSNRCVMPGEIQED